MTGSKQFPNVIEFLTIMNVIKENFNLVKNWVDKYNEVLKGQNLNQIMQELILKANWNDSKTKDLLLLTKFIPNLISSYLINV